MTCIHLAFRLFRWKDVLLKILQIFYFLPSESLLHSNESLFIQHIFKVNVSDYIWFELQKNVLYVCTILRVFCQTLLRDITENTSSILIIFTRCLLFCINLKYKYILFNKVR